MTTETDTLGKLAFNNKIDPFEFDVTISALLIGIGAEKYIELFKKQNIGQCTLLELSENDLIKIGVDNADIRKKLMEEVKNLPIYEKSDHISKSISKLSPIEIIEILEESSQHLHRIYLSVLANSLALKKSKHITDSLIYADKYGSDIALSTLSEITCILNSMDLALHTQFKIFAVHSSKVKRKKIIIGTIGSAVVGVLAVLFVKSVKNII